MSLTVDELLTTTRTVRKRLDLTRPVPLELIKECLEIALQAPSGSNRQGWSWMVVTDPEQKAQLGELYKRSYDAYAPHARAAAAELYADDPSRVETQMRVSDSSTYLADHMHEVPAMVIPCIEAGNLPAGNQSGLWGSILPAAWSYCLAARERGLGTAWTTLHLRYEKEAAEVLGLPAGIAQAALLPTAYYTGDTFKPAPRQPLAEVLHLDRW
jgi:nitroreductase